MGKHLWEIMCKIKSETLSTTLLLLRGTAHLPPLNTMFPKYSINTMLVIIHINSNTHIYMCVCTHENVIGVNFYFMDEKRPTLFYSTLLSSPSGTAVLLLYDSWIYRCQNMNYSRWGSVMFIKHQNQSRAESNKQQQKSVIEFPHVGSASCALM